MSAPLQNRVQPTGEILSDPARGLLTGNRGILHRPDRTLGRARWQHPHWVCCTLSFRGRYHGPMPDRRWTALFFLDEAVALAAGHRPCHQCRHADAMRFRAAWVQAHGGPAKAADMDRALHLARVRRDRSQVRYSAPAADLPAGVFIQSDGQTLLLGPHRAHPYLRAGYGAPIPRPAGPVTVLTPAPIVACLAAGYQPLLHPSAGR